MTDDRLTHADVARVMAPVLKQGGWSRRGRWWRVASPEVQWAFHLDHPPRRRTAGLALYCAPLTPGFETPSTLEGDSFPLALMVLPWELAPGVKVYWIEHLDDMPLEREEHLGYFTQTAHMINEYVQQHSTTESLVRAYAAGELHGAFLQWQLRDAFTREAQRLGLTIQPKPGKREQTE